jgi:hypothetical protein
MNRFLLEVMLAILVALALTGFLKQTGACAAERPLYGPDGRYNGSVFDYGKMQTYTDRSGQFNGSAVNNGNGTTSLFNRNGNFTGSSIDRAFNFNRR